MKIQKIITAALLFLLFIRARADEPTQQPEKSSCAQALREAAHREGSLSMDELRVAFAALEDEGYVIELRLFNRRNPAVDQILTRALGKPAIADDVYFSLPREKTLKMVRNELLGHREPKVPPRSMRRNQPPPKALEPVTTEIAPPEFIDDKEWLTRILLLMERSGTPPNFANIARDGDGEAILEAIHGVFGGSLYDALEAAGIDPKRTFLAKNPLSVPDFMQLAGKIKSHRLASRSAKDLPDAAAMEFPLETGPLVKVLMEELLEATTASPVALAAISSDRLSRPVTSEEVIKVLSEMANRQSLTVILNWTR